MHLEGRTMRTAIAAAWLGTALVAAAAAQTTPDSRSSDSLERAFATNGRIRMDLSAGDYRIEGGDASRIRVEWSVKDPSQLARTKVSADVRGADATISTDTRSNSNFKAVIRVPAQADLYVRLTAGDLRVENVRGNKDVELHAGDLDIDVVRAEDYQHVDASLWAGDLTARPFNVVKEGLFRSFEWKGSGPYRLHAHLKAGDLRLFAKPE
jgi:hypothetical protein